MLHSRSLLCWPRHIYIHYLVQPSSSSQTTNVLQFENAIQKVRRKNYKIKQKNSELFVQSIIIIFFIFHIDFNNLLLDANTYSYVPCCFFNLVSLSGLPKSQSSSCLSNSSQIIDYLCMDDAKLKCLTNEMQC
jgi:hypothetical protein